MHTCTRKLEFDAAHRLIAHETKCANVHGHRYVVEVTCAAWSLDNVGRVIDFGEIKRIFGGWIDEHLDHTIILNSSDTKLIDLCNEVNKKPVFVVPFEPSAEYLVAFLLQKANELLNPANVQVIHVRLYETPNGFADAFVSKGSSGAPLELQRFGG
jgi:6-pyruvoyltetrahydropterin/6-carboxytetrahydropterin synthase